MRGALANYGAIPFNWQVAGRCVPAWGRRQPITQSHKNNRLEQSLRKGQTTVYYSGQLKTANWPSNQIWHTSTIIWSGQIFRTFWQDLCSQFFKVPINPYCFTSSCTHIWPAWLLKTHVSKSAEWTDDLSNIFEIQGSLRKSGIL